MVMYQEQPKKRPKKAKSGAAKTNLLQQHKDKVRQGRADQTQLVVDRERARKARKSEKEGGTGSEKSISKAAVQEEMKKTDLGALGRAARKKKAQRKATTTTIPQKKKKRKPSRGMLRQQSRSFRR